MRRSGKRPVPSAGLLFALFGALIAPAAAAAAAGDIDRSFGTGGTVLTDFGSRDDFGNEAAVGGDGSIVVVGSTREEFNAPPGSGQLPNEDTNELVVLRYRPSGRLDRSFGTNGRVRLQFDGHVDARGMAVAIQPDGRIVVAGRAARVYETEPDPWAFDPTPQTYTIDRYLLLRLSPSGQLDGSFGNGGVVLGPTAMRNVATDVTVQRSGKILVAGEVGWESDPYVARYRANGAVDPTFGDGRAAPGHTVFLNRTNGTHAEPRLALARRGRIVVGLSAAYDRDIDRMWVLCRLRSSGVLDRAFGGCRRVNFNPDGFYSEYLAGLKTLRDGRVWAAGGLHSTGDIAVGRVTRSGQLDSSLPGGAKGIVPSRRFFTVQSATFQGRKTLVAGTAFRLARVGVDARLDRTFAGDGFSRAALNGGADIPNALVRQGRRRVVAVGRARGSVGGDLDIALARFELTTPRGSH